MAAHGHARAARMSGFLARNAQHFERYLAQIADAGLVVGLARAQRVRELVVPVRLVGLSLLLEAAAECVVGVVVGRRELEHRAELRLRGVPAVDAEVGDAQRLADRRLLGLAALRLLQRNGRLSGAAVLQMRFPLLEQVVCLVSTHRIRLRIRRGLAAPPLSLTVADPASQATQRRAPAVFPPLKCVALQGLLRYVKLCRIRSTGCVKSRVPGTTTPRTSTPAARARPNASASSNGGPGSSSRNGTTSPPSIHSGTLVSSRGSAKAAARRGSTAGSPLRAAIAPGAPSHSSTKRSSVPAAKTWSAPATSTGGSAPPASARPTASADPSARGCRTYAIRIPKPEPSPSSASTCSAR